MVRPIYEFDSIDDVGELLLRQPVESGGFRNLLVAINDGGSVYYVMLLMLSEDLYLSGTLAACVINGDYANFVDASDIDVVTNIMSLPCMEQEDVIEDIAVIYRQFIANLANVMGWSQDEVICNERSSISNRQLECRYIG